MGEEGGSSMWEGCRMLHGSGGLDSFTSILRARRAFHIIPPHASDGHEQTFSALLLPLPSQCPFTDCPMNDPWSGANPAWSTGRRKCSLHCLHIMPLLVMHSIPWGAVLS